MCFQGPRRICRQNVKEKVPHCDCKKVSMPAYEITAYLKQTIVDLKAYIYLLKNYLKK